MKKFIAVLIILFLVFGTINSARSESDAVDYTVSLGSLNQFSLVALHDASVSGHIRGSIWVGGTLTGDCYVDDGSIGGTGAGNSYIYNNQSTVQFKGRTSEQSTDAYIQLAESAIRSNANYWYDVMNDLGDNGTTCIYIAPDESGHASMVTWEQGWQQYQCAGSDEAGGSCNTVYWTDAISVDVAGLEGFVIAPRASVNVLSSNNCLSIVGNSITMNWAEIHVNSGYPSTVQPTPTPTEEPTPTPTPEPVNLTINKTLIGSVWHVRCDVMDGTSFRAGGGYWKEDVIKNPAANTGKEGHRSNKCGNADNWVIWVNANGVPFRMDEIKSGATGGTLPTVLYRERIPMTGAEIQALSADDPEGIWRYSQNFQDQMDYSEIVPGQRIYWITWNGSQVWYHSGVPYKVDAPTYTLYIDGEGYNLVANGGSVTIEDLEVGIHTLVEENYPDTYISHIYVNGVSLESYDGSIEITEDTVITVENTLITPEPTSPNPPNPPVVTTPPAETETPTPETTEPDETETPEPEESETPGPEPTETEEPEPTETETITPEPTESEEPEPTESEEPEPTESEEPEPTESEEPEPTESEEPEPTESEEPKPTESEEPEITETPGPEPTESEEPEPTESEEPEPTESEIPEPTESNEPEPTESDEPEPTESEIPEPTESDEPEPTESEEPEPTESDEPTPTESDEPEPTETEEPLPTPEESETPTPTPKKSDPTPTPEIIIPTVKPTETPINYCQFTVRKYVSNYWDMEPTTFFFKISGIGLEEDLYIEIYVDKNTAGEGVYKTQELRAGKYTVEEIDIPQGFYIVSDKEITKYIIGTDMEYVFENRAIPPTTPTPSEVPTTTPTPEPTPTPTATVTTSPKPSEVPTDETTTPTSTASEIPTGTPAPTDDNPVVPTEQQSDVPPTSTSTPTATPTTTATPTVTPTTSPEPTTTVVPVIKKAEIGHELIERPPLEEGVEAPEVPGVVAVVLTSILDYDTPLGVNVMINHVGDCFE